MQRFDPLKHMAPRRWHEAGAHPRQLHIWIESEDDRIHFKAAEHITANREALTEVDETTHPKSAPTPTPLDIDAELARN